MKQITTAFLFLLLNISCKKTADTPSANLKTCWKITDAMFTDKSTECDKTAAEIAVLHPDGYYYRSDEPLLCWYDASTRNYSSGLPASLKSKFLNPAFVVVSCGYCARWYHREKKKYIPTGGITYSPIRVEQFCGDTVRTLFRGREIPLRQSADSIITTQFSDNGANW